MILFISEVPKLKKNVTKKEERSLLGVGRLNYLNKITYSIKLVKDVSLWTYAEKRTYLGGKQNKTLSLFFLRDI